MSTSEVFSGFCVFCYQSIYVCPKAANSSQSVTKFTKFIGKLTGKKGVEKLLKGDDDCELNSELKLQCCNECNIIIDGFCNYYHQFKVLELQMNWKLEQIAIIINHCNRVPSRWKTISASLEETFPDDIENRLKSQALVRKYRQAIAETCSQMYPKNEPRVLLKTNLDVTQHSNTMSQSCFNIYNSGVEDTDNAVADNDVSSISVDFEIEEEMSNDDEFIIAKNLDVGQSTPLTGSTIQVKIEASTVLPVLDAVDNEIQTDEQDNPNTSNLINVETNVGISPTSEYPQIYNLRRKGKHKAAKSEETNSDNDSDDEFTPEPNSERFSSESDSNGSTYEEDKTSQKSTPSKRLKSNSEIFKLRKMQSHRCPKCNKSFGLAYHCRRHIKNNCCSKKLKLADVVPVPLDLKCGECDFIFMTKEQYWLHQRKDHEHILCIMCGRKFRGWNYLKRHNCHKKYPTYPPKKEHLNLIHASLIVNSVQHSIRNKNWKVDKIPAKSEHRFRCKCLKWFKNPEVFKNHENSHIKREFQCKFCPHLATNVLKLSSHEYQNHCPDTKKEQDQLQSNQPANTSLCLSCPRCEYKSTGIVDYQLHFAQAHFTLETDPDPDKTCPKCFKTFVNRSDFLNHMESHKDRKDWKWQCDECGRKFTTNKLLRRHILWHNDGFKWECSQCGKKCITRSKLEIHVKSHSNTKNIRRGKDTEGIKALEKLGFNTRSRKCEICGRVLANFSKKCRHMKECHDLPGITDKSKCPHCDVDGCTAYFLTKNQLRFHRIRRHEDKNVDKLETFGFSSKRKECEICDRVLRNFSRKCKHMKECHGLPGITDKSKRMYCGVDGCAVYFMTGVQLLYHRVAKHGYKFGKEGRSGKVKQRQRVKLNN